jgi:hypothetical protein
LDVLVQGVRSLLGGVGRPFRGVAARLRTRFRGLDARLRGLLKALDVQIPRGNNPPAPAPPEREDLPLPELPEEEAELPPLEVKDAAARAREDAGREADASLAAVFAVGGACLARGDSSGSGRVARKRQRAAREQTHA